MYLLCIYWCCLFCKYIELRLWFRKSCIHYIPQMTKDTQRTTANIYGDQESRHVSVSPYPTNHQKCPRLGCSLLRLQSCSHRDLAVVTCHASLVTLCPRLVTCHTSLVTRSPGQRTGGHVTARVTRHWSHGARGWSQCLRGHTALAIQSPGQRRGGQRDGGQQVAGPGLRVASPGHLATSAVCHPRAVPSLTPGSEVATLAAHLPPGARRDYGAVNCFISFGLQVM